MWGLGPMDFLHRCDLDRFHHRLHISIVVAAVLFVRVIFIVCHHPQQFDSTIFVLLQTSSSECTRCSMTPRVRKENKKGEGGSSSSTILNLSRRKYVSAAALNSIQKEMNETGVPGAKSASTYLRQRKKSLQSEHPFGQCYDCIHSAAIKRWRHINSNDESLSFFVCSLVGKYCFQDVFPFSVRQAHEQARDCVLHKQNYSR